MVVDQHTMRGVRRLCALMVTLAWKEAERRPKPLPEGNARGARQRRTAARRRAMDVAIARAWLKGEHIGMLDIHDCARMTGLPLTDIARKVDAL